ncbi:HIT family protein [Buchananella felis]|uniref:HIT family protein n=1 Tax=Buchananella felis TaxID=3231492 RepID=UPI003528BEF3
MSGLYCDESGLCEEIERIRSGGSCDRLVASSNDWLALVDISPLVEGHLLICPTRHVHSTLDLPFPESTWQSLHEYAALTAKRFGYANYMLLEHGTRSHYCGPSCVKHVHVHLVLGQGVNWENALNGVAEWYVDCESFHGARGCIEEVASYLILSSSPFDWRVAIPKGGIRQCSRALIARAAGVDENRVDWVIWAEGDDHRKAVAHFVRSDSNRLR